MEPGREPAAVAPGPARPPQSDERSDLKVVLQFFIVPLSLVVVLVSVFFGLQILRGRPPDSATTLRALEEYHGFLARYVGEVKRWQSGYDLSLLLRADDPGPIRALVPNLTAAFREAGERGDVELRRYLALALGRSDDPRAVASLRAGLGDRDAETRLFACWGLLEIGDRAALPDLRAALADADPGVRKMAIYAVGRMGDRSSQPALRSALADPEADVRWNAALALSRLGDAAAVPVLVDLLRASVSGTDSEEAGARHERALNAIRGLALLRAPEGRAPLGQAAATADDPGVREAARAVLGSYDAQAGRGSP
jgi:hypothetical protein